MTEPSAIQTGPSGKAEIGRDDADVAVGHVLFSFLYRSPGESRDPLLPSGAAERGSRLSPGLRLLFYDYPFTWRMMPTHLSSSGKILSAGSGGQPATTREMPRSR